MLAVSIVHFPIVMPAPVRPRWDRSHRGIRTSYSKHSFSKGVRDPSTRIESESMKRRKDHLVRAAALLSAILFSACGSDRPDGGLPREANGRVLNTAPQWRSGEEWRVSDEPVLVIGGAQSEGADDLFGVAGAVRLSDGRIAIADRGASGIRLYSSGGSHVRTSGGKGSGPGEFRGVDGIARIRGDTILVWDRSAGRMSVFDPAGSFTQSHQPSGLNLLPAFAGAFPDGTYAVTTGTSPANVMAQSRTTRQDTIVIVHVGRKGELLDTIGRFAGPEMFVDVSGGSLTVERVIFGEGSSMAVGAGRLVAGTNTRYELTAYTPDGVEAMRVARDKPRVRATRADVERYREFLASRNLGSVPPEVRAGAEQRVAAIPHREMLPSFGELRVDETGHVWVAQFGLPGQPQKWDVFDPAGVWLGTVGMPGDLVVHEIGMDYVLGVATDELGVERVVLYRLQRT